MPENAVILLAEDEEDYVVFIKKAFSRADIGEAVHVVPSAAEAMAYLKGEANYANRAEYPLPDVLVLDMKLLQGNAMRIIGWARSQAALSNLRILVLTSADRVKDVSEAYRLGAHAFLVKPYDFEDIFRLSALILDFWRKTSLFPDGCAPPGNHGIAEPDRPQSENQ